MFGLNWKHILWIISLLLLVAGYRILSPLMTVTWHQALELISIQNQLKSPPLVKEEIVNLRIKNKKISEYIRNFRVQMPSGNELSFLYSELGNRARTHRIRLNKLTPRPVETNNEYKTMPIQLLFDAKFGDLIRFCHSLENRSGLFQIHQLDIEVSRNRGSEVTGKLKLNAYLR